MFVNKSKFLLILIVPALILSIFCSCATPKQRLSKTFIDYFDTAITVIGYDSKDNFDSNCEIIEQNLSKYHRLFDIYNSYDDLVNLYVVNQNAGKTVKVDVELIEFLSLCKDMYRLTNGKTNVALGSVLSIWHNARNESVLPDMENLTTAAKHCDIENVIIDSENQTVMLKDSSMSLDVGAIAKGYALQNIVSVLEQQGVTGYAINAGGMVMCLGVRGDGSDWSVGIENPKNTSEILLSITPGDLAVVTSGTYQRYFEKDGVRYHHIINPDTLMPENDYLSVTVLTEDCGLGDALSTALFNMSVEEGKALLSALEVRAEAMWVLPDQTKIETDGFQKHIKK